jgi:hypothetical protein
MARLLSVNVGLPREVAWNGKTVRTAVWKLPVKERRMVRSSILTATRKGISLVMVASSARYLFTRWTPTITGSAFWAAMTSVSVSSEKTSPLKDCSTKRFASVIGTALVKRYLK